MRLRDFTPYNREGDVWHCERCHALIRCYEVNTETEVNAILTAHNAFTCRAARFDSDTLRILGWAS